MRCDHQRFIGPRVADGDAVTIVWYRIPWMSSPAHGGPAAAPDAPVRRPLTETAGGPTPGNLGAPQLVFRIFAGGWRRWRSNTQRRNGHARPGNPQDIEEGRATMDASVLRAAWVYDVHAFVLGTDGQSSANGAVRMAHFLAEREGAPLHIVGVVDGLPPARVGAYRPAGEAESALVVELRARIEERLFMLGIRADASDIEIVVGHTDGALDDIAKRQHARLIFVGRRVRSARPIAGIIDRVRDGSTRGGTRAGRRPASEGAAARRGGGNGLRSGQPCCRAGSAFVALVPRGCSISYTFAGSSPPLASARSLWMLAYETELADRVSRVADALDAPTDGRIVEHVLYQVVRHHRLLAFAQAPRRPISLPSASDGDHQLRRGAPQWASVAARILAAGRGSVLVAA